MKFSTFRGIKRISSKNKFKLFGIHEVCGILVIDYYNKRGEMKTIYHSPDKAKLPFYIMYGGNIIDYTPRKESLK